jgi:hypothetical protein
MAKNVQNDTPELPDLEGFKSIMSELSDSMERIVGVGKKIPVTAIATKNAFQNVSTALKDVLKVGTQIADNQKNLMTSKFREVNVEEELKTIQELKAQISLKSFRHYTDQQNILLKELDMHEAELKKMQAMGVLQSKLRDTSMSLAEELTAPLQKFSDALGGIPVFGKSIQTMLAPALQKITTNVGTGLSKMFLNAQTAAGGFSKSLFVGLGALAAIALLLKLAWDRYQEIEDAAENVRIETGFTNSQFKQGKVLIEDISTNFAEYGVTAEKVSNSMKALSKEWGNVNALTREAVETVSLLNANYGVGAEDAAAAYKTLFNFTSGNAAKVNQLLATGITLSQGLGVSFSQVMGDIAAAGEDSYTYFKGDATALMQAAINARKVGTNLSAITKAADSLLDFDSSLEKQMNASAIIGKNVDFSAARYAALTGDITKATDLVMQQVEALGDLNKLNVIQKKALAEASGFSVQELGAMIEQKDILKSMTPEMRKQYDLAEGSLKSMELSTAEKAKQILYDKQMQSTTSKLSNMWKGIVNILAGILLPVFEILEPIVMVILWAVKTVLDAVNTIVQAIYGVFKAIGNMIGSGSFNVGNAFEKTKSAYKAGGQDFSFIPEIQLADGGIVTKPTTAMIGEGTSPEAVIPLDNTGIKTQSDPLLVKLLEDILNAIKSGGNVYLDSRKVGTSLAMNAAVPI